MASAAFLKRPRTPPSNGPAVDYQSADSEHLMKRIRGGQSEEVHTEHLLRSILDYMMD